MAPLPPPPPPAPVYHEPVHEEHHVVHHVTEHSEPYHHNKESYGKTVHKYHHDGPAESHAEYETVHYEHKEPHKQHYKVEEHHRYEHKEPHHQEYGHHHYEHKEPHHEEYEHHHYKHEEPYHEEYEHHRYEHDEPIHHRYKNEEPYHKEYTHHSGPYEIKVKYDKKGHSFADDLVEQYLKDKLVEATKELGLNPKITTIFPNGGNAPTVSVHSAAPALAIQPAITPGGVTVHHPATAHSPEVTVHHPAPAPGVTVHHPATALSPAVTVHHPAEHHAVTVQHPVDHHAVTVNHHGESVTVHNTPGGVAVHHTADPGVTHHVAAPGTVAVHTPGHTVVHDAGHGVHVSTGPAVPLPLAPAPLTPAIHVPVSPLAPLPGPTPIPGLLPGALPPIPGLPPLPGQPSPSVPIPIDSLINLLQSHAINLTPKGAIGQLPHPPFPHDDYVIDDDDDEFRGFSPEFDVLDEEDYFIIDSKLNDNDDEKDKIEDEVEAEAEELKKKNKDNKDRLAKLQQQRQRLTALLSQQSSALTSALGNNGSPLLSRLTSLNKKMHTLEDNLSKCGQEGARQQLRLANLENAARFQKEYSDQKDEQIRQLLQTIDKLEEQVQSFKEKINVFEHEINVISTELDTKDKTLANLKNREIRQFSQLQNLLQNKQQTIKSQLQKIDETASKLVEMQREVRRSRETRGQLRSLIHSRNEEIGMLNTEKDNLVEAVKDLANLNFKHILDRSSRHTTNNNPANNVEVIQILEKHQLDPKSILRNNENSADIINQQEKTVFGDLAITTASPNEYSTMSTGEAIEDTLVENDYVDSYDGANTYGEEKTDSTGQANGDSDTKIEDNYSGRKD